MFAFVLASAVVLQGPVTVPTFGSWDGKTWAGISLGTSENALGKQVQKSKTVGPDPASVRIGVDKKGTILAAILTATNNKGSVCGFTVDLEKDQPIESLEALQGELGPADYLAFADTRYSDWAVEVWASKGIAAAVQNGDRPLVYKVLLTDPATLTKHLDVWTRTPNQIQDPPRLPVAGFTIAIDTDPKRRELEDDLYDGIRYRTRRLMDGPGGPGWAPGPDSGSRIRVGFTVKRDKGLNLSGSMSVNVHQPSGDFSFNEQSYYSIDRDDDLHQRTDAMFDELLNKLQHDLDTKYRRIGWQTEWRQFTGLSKP